MSGQPRSSAAVRYLLVFVVALACLGALAGKRLFAPSQNNHFSHLANSWVHGQLHHEGRPPGYCDAKRRARGKCRSHTMNDWAVVWSLELRDGRTVRGYPCRTEACRVRGKQDRVESWWLTDGSLQEYPRGEITKRSDTWYVSFPPGPAVFMLPLVAVGGIKVWDPLVTAIAAALIPVVLVRFLDRIRGVDKGRGVEHLFVAAAWVLASPACFLAANGNVWFTAQIFGALWVFAFIDSAWECRRPALAGLFLGLAIACRPTTALVVVVFAAAWWRAGRPRMAAVRFLGPLLVIGAVLMALNLARFENPFEFGHRYLEIRWQARMQEVGMFSLDYLGRNLRCLLALLPVSDPRFPGFKVSLHGTALWVTTPWLFAAVLGRKRFTGRLELWLAALLVAVPPLLYQNSGQVQFTYRFAVDWLPLVVVALALGGAAHRKRFFAVLVVSGALLQMYGAYQFRNVQRLFVVDPLGWPFEHELERDRTAHR